MIGIITKDIYQSILIQKSKITLLYNYLLMLACLLFPKGSYGLLFAVLWYIPFSIVPILIQMTTERDAVSGFDKIQLTFPVTRKDVIKSKYILGVGFMFLNLLITSIAIMIHLFVYKTIGAEFGLFIFIMSLVLSLISLAINNVSYICLGSKGSIIYTGLMVVCIFLFLNPQLFGIEYLFTQVLEMTQFTLISIAVILSIILLYTSYKIATWYYSKKEIN